MRARLHTIVSSEFSFLSGDCGALVLQARLGDAAARMPQG